MISITSLCSSTWSFATGIFFFTSIARMKCFAKSVCRCLAKSSAVVVFGSKKQSGSLFPSLSSSFFVPPGYIALYSSKLKTALFITSCTPVLLCSSRNAFA